jgi:hypothetical protein
MIKFKCFIPEVIKETPIVKSKPSMFKWFNRAVEDFKKNSKNLHTAKCPGIISVLNQGWIQCAYQDLTITTNGDLNSFKWETTFDQIKTKYGDIISDYVSFHQSDQLEKFKKFEKNTLTTIIKIQSPWYVTIPDGYSLLSMPVPYNDDSRFTAATGLLKGSNFLNIQLYWHRINSKEKIEKGTPLCYYLLMKNEIFTEEISEINDEDAFKIHNIQENKRIEKKI